MNVPVEILKIAKLRELELEILKFDQNVELRECPTLKAFCVRTLKSLDICKHRYLWNVVGCTIVLNREVREVIREERDHLMSDPTIMEIISDFLIEKTCA